VPGTAQAGKLEIVQKADSRPQALTEYRNEMIERTTTEWYMVVDGDEIWPEKNLDMLILATKQCHNETIALVNRTRNAVGDLRHYLPESEGHYQIGQWKGHLNIRAIRNLPGLTVKGVYPNEWYELSGVKIQEYPPCLLSQESPGRMVRRLPERYQDFCLKFVDTWYLHTTHLKRSERWLSELSTIDRLKKHKWFYRFNRFRGMKLLKMRKSGLAPPIWY